MFLTKRRIKHTRKCILLSEMALKHSQLRIGVTMSLLWKILRIRPDHSHFSYKFKSSIKKISPKLSARQLCTKNTIGDIVRRWHQRFENEGISEPIESIEHIVAHVIGTRKIMDLISLQRKELTSNEIEKLEMLCECRLARMPVQYIIGEWDFRDITLKLVPPVFIPRPETEILVDFVLKRISAGNFNDSCDVLEVGCGSGAISLALLHACKKIKALAIDTNTHACALTLENAKNLELGDRLTVINATLEEDATIKVSSEERAPDFSKETFDFIISNPPYVPTKQVFKLMPEIKLYEDVRALDGGTDGLKVIKPLLNYSANALKPGGRLFMEIDPAHSEYIKFFTAKYTNLKLKYEHTYKDFCNNDRFVEVSKVDISQIQNKQKT